MPVEAAPQPPAAEPQPGSRGHQQQDTTGGHVCTGNRPEQHSDAAEQQQRPLQPGLYPGRQYSPLQPQVSGCGRRDQAPSHEEHEYGEQHHRLSQDNVLGAGQFCDIAHLRQHRGQGDGDQKRPGCAVPPFLRRPHERRCREHDHGRGEQSVGEQRHRTPGCSQEGETPRQPERQ
ncbi:hypothetical protein KBTX_00418 [wastewater metagenome]|uniref:Uncharacterized protein n=2 Tax=unclassified sequences TaxID=12908 RepID=A0A5B8RBG7_9ZZZZ|nr:hypothetical protein KBTEX_00418 [uncultured organism]